MMRYTQVCIMTRYMNICIVMWNLQKIFIMMCYNIYIYHIMIWYISTYIYIYVLYISWLSRFKLSQLIGFSPFFGGIQLRKIPVSTMVSSSPYRILSLYHPRDCDSDLTGSRRLDRGGSPKDPVVGPLPNGHENGL